MRPFGHSAEGKEEARQHDRWEHVQEAHLHRLQLIAGHRRDEKAEAEAADDEQEQAKYQPGPAAGHRHVEQQPGQGDDEGRLDDAHEDVRGELAHHHFERPQRGGEDHTR